MISSRGGMEGAYWYCIVNCVLFFSVWFGLFGRGNRSLIGVGSLIGWVGRGAELAWIGLGWGFRRR